MGQKRIFPVRRDMKQKNHPFQWYQCKQWTDLIVVSGSRHTSNNNWTSFRNWAIQFGFDFNFDHFEHYFMRYSIFLNCCHRDAIVLKMFNNNNNNEKNAIIFSVFFLCVDFMRIHCTSLCIKFCHNTLASCTMQKIETVICRIHRSEATSKICQKNHLLSILWFDSFCPCISLPVSC